ncbi:hypothetical protein FZEAL_3106 [Fusarium zealandicum]|uniref:DUF7907 domain-containing protein n=1 Tax=Fusarium zealandicum TaxID=1053134 RepID=A0A8H4XM40_9HYPO|nr:hypothetical protein FZEAL_3106 [Fusarium zealandicum]
MLASTLFLSILSLAAASPLAYEEVKNPRYPTRSSSKGFRLAINVTDHSKDFDPPIHNSFVTSIHTGAGLNLVGVSEKNGRIFYQNGTKEERQNGLATIITDGGTPLTPSGFALKKNKKNKNLFDTTLNFGPGTPGAQLNRLDDPYTYLLPETFVACNESLPYYQGKYFVVIKQAHLTIDKNNKIQRNIPKGCAPIRLVPECAELEDLPKGSYSSHKYALNSKCYEDVSKIKWKQYSP